MKSFEQWWIDLVALGEKLDWPINRDDRESYREYFDDGDTPEDVVEFERSADGG